MFDIHSHQMYILQNSLAPHTQWIWSHKIDETKTYTAAIRMPHTHTQTQTPTHAHTHSHLMCTHKRARRIIYAVHGEISFSFLSLLVERICSLLGFNRFFSSLSLYLPLSLPFHLDQADQFTFHSQFSQKFLSLEKKSIEFAMNAQRN